MDRFGVFLERYQDIERAIEAGHPKKILHGEKIGHPFLLAYDETKRMLAVCGTEKVSPMRFLSIIC